MRPSLFLRLLPLVTCALAPVRGASPEPPPIMAALDGVLRGTTLTPDGYFRWKSSEAQWGVLGTFTGSTREFEEITVEVGGDRTVYSSGVRAAYEAQRVRLELERGQDVKVELKGDLSIVRVRKFSGDSVYVCATKQVGRGVVFVRGDRPVEPKKEAGLVKLVQATVATVGMPSRW